MLKRFARGRELALSGVDVLLADAEIVIRPAGEIRGPPSHSLQARQRLLFCFPLVFILDRVEFAEHRLDVFVQCAVILLERRRDASQHLVGFGQGSGFVAVVEPFDDQRFGPRVIRLQQHDSQGRRVGLRNVANQGFDAAHRVVVSRPIFGRVHQPLGVQIGQALSKLFARRPGLRGFDAAFQVDHVQVDETKPGQQTLDRLVVVGAYAFTPNDQGDRQR